MGLEYTHLIYKYRVETPRWNIKKWLHIIFQDFLISTWHLHGKIFRTHFFYHQKDLLWCYILLCYFLLKIMKLRIHVLSTDFFRKDILKIHYCFLAFTQQAIHAAWQTCNLFYLYWTICFAGQFEAFFLDSNTSI